MEISGRPLPSMAGEPSAAAQQPAPNKYFFLTFVPAWKQNASTSQQPAWPLKQNTVPTHKRWRFLSDTQKADTTYQPTCSCRDTRSPTMGACSPAHRKQPAGERRDWKCSSPHTGAVGTLGPKSKDQPKCVTMQSSKLCVHRIRRSKLYPV